MDNKKEEVKQVFISSSSKDEEKAFLISKILERNGFSCWMELRDLEGEKTYGEEISEIIKQVTVVILIFSKNSNLSKHVANEIEIAHKAGKIIIPLRIDNTLICPELDRYLNQEHWIEASPWNVNRVDEVLNYLRSCISHSLSAFDLDDEDNDGRFDMLQNGQGEIVLLLNYKKSVPKDPRIVYEGKRKVVVYRNSDSSLEFTIDIENSEAMKEVKELTIVEVLDGTIAREYKAPIKLVFAF